MEAVTLSNVTSLCRKRGFTLLGVRAMRKLGITISFRKVKEEPKHPEPIFPSAYRYDNQDSSKFPRSNSLSCHAVMVPSCKTSHAFFMSSLKPGCQHKTKNKCPRLSCSSRFPPSLVTICLPYRIDYRLSNGCHVAHAHAHYISRVHF